MTSSFETFVADELAQLSSRIIVQYRQEASISHQAESEHTVPTSDISQDDAACRSDVSQEQQVPSTPVAAVSDGDACPSEEPASPHRVTFMVTAPTDKEEPMQSCLSGSSNSGDSSPAKALMARPPPLLNLKKMLGSSSSIRLEDSDDDDDDDDSETPPDRVCEHLNSERSLQVEPDLMQVGRASARSRTSSPRLEKGTDAIKDAVEEAMASMLPGMSSPTLSLKSAARKMKQSLQMKRTLTVNNAEGVPLLQTPLCLHDTWLAHEDVEDDEVIDRKLTMFNVEDERLRHTKKMTALPRSQSMMGLNNHDRTSWVLDPSNPKRIAWDAIGVMLIGYDVVFIPLTVFELAGRIFATMQWISLVYWSVDIPASFLVGYHDSGMLEMGMMNVAKRYIKTFFFIDVMLVAIDCIVMAMDLITHFDSTGSSTGIARIAKTYRMVRILRGLRLLRLIKLPQAFAGLSEHITSEFLLVCIGILKHTVGIMLLNHFIACLWYTICDLGESPQSWLSNDRYHESKAYLYFTSLHWSLTQFTPAGMEVTPSSLQERIFTVIVIMFALVIFSSFVSSITNSMNTLRNMNSEHSKNFSHMQRYFRNNGISLSLCVRARRHVDYKIEMQTKSIQEKDVKFLHLLSVPLQRDLHYEVFAPVFRWHSFFSHFDHNHQRCLKSVCHDCMETIHVSDCDSAFHRGDEAEKCYILKKGTVRYTTREEQEQLDTKQGRRGPPTAPSPLSDFKEVEEGSWMAESILWTNWVHHGRAQASREVTLVAVNSSEFQICALENCAASGGSSHYATLYVEHLNSLPVDELTDLAFPDFDREWASSLAFMKREELKRTSREGEGYNSERSPRRLSGSST